MDGFTCAESPGHNSLGVAARLSRRSGFGHTASAATVFPLGHVLVGGWGGGGVGSSPPNRNVRPAENRRFWLLSPCVRGRPLKPGTSVAQLKRTLSYPTKVPAFGRSWAATVQTDKTMAPMIFANFFMRDYLFVKYASGFRSKSLPQ